MTELSWSNGGARTAVDAATELEYILVDRAIIIYVCVCMHVHVCMYVMAGAMIVEWTQCIFKVHHNELHLNFSPCSHCIIILIGTARRRPQGRTASTCNLCSESSHSSQRELNLDAECEGTVKTYQLPHV